MQAVRAPADHLLRANPPAAIPPQTCLHALRKSSAGSTSAQFARVEIVASPCSPRRPHFAQCRRLLTSYPSAGFIPKTAPQISPQTHLPSHPVPRASQNNGGTDQQRSAWPASSHKGPRRRPAAPAPQLFSPSPASISPGLNLEGLPRFARRLVLGLGMSLAVLAALFLAPQRQRSSLPFLNCHVATAHASEAKASGGGANEGAQSGSGSTLASVAQALPQDKEGLAEAWKALPVRIQYEFDTMLEKRPGSYVLLLVCCILTLVYAGGYLYRSTSPPSERSDPFWDAWSCIVKSDVHLKETTSVGRTIGLLLALGGLFFYSLLTSTLTANFKQRMEWLRQGAHSPVLEKDHIIVGGTNHHLPTILRALNKQQEDAARDGTSTSRKRVVVVLTEGSKKDADRLVTPLVKECGHLSLLVRSGSTTKTASFKRVAADSAKAILLLATKDDPYDADAEAVASVLALKPVMESNEQANIVVEVSKPSTGELLESVPGLRVSAVEDLSAKLFAQCTHQPELFQVLHSFNPENQVINPRIYPSLAGLPFGEVRRGFTEAVVIGWIRNGAVDFHPSDTEKLRADDTLLVVSAKGLYAKPPEALEKLAKGRGDPSQGPLKARLPKSSSQSQGSVKEKPVAERLLVLGWRPTVPSMLREYDEYLGPGSEVTVLSPDDVQVREGETSRALERPLQNIKIVHKLGNPMSRKDLERAIFDKGSSFSKHMTAKDGKMAFENVPFSITAVASKTWRSGDSKADKDTIYSMLLAKLICQRNNVKVRNYTAEFQDLRMATEALGSDPTIRSICTSDLLAAIAAGVSQQRELNPVWTELLNSWGNEFYLKDIRKYMRPGTSPTFAELAERAVSRKEVAVGYRKAGQVVVNPCPKDVPLSFSEGDTLVVISETDLEP